MIRQSNVGQNLFQTLRNIAVLLVVASVTVACVSTEAEPQKLRTQIDSLYPHLSEEIKEFFSEEAHRAGVKKIRELRVGETPKKVYSQQSGCGSVQFDGGLILVNPRKAHCLRLAHLAHEITHIGVARTGCYGHGDKFYEYNLGIARRFEEQFPVLSDRGGWGSPVQSVENRARYYRSDAENCV